MGLKPSESECSGGPSPLHAALNAYYVSTIINKAVEVVPKIQRQMWKHLQVYQ